MKGRERGMKEGLRKRRKAGDREKANKEEWIGGNEKKMIEEKEE